MYKVVAILREEFSGRYIVKDRANVRQSRFDKSISPVIKYNGINFMVVMYHVTFYEYACKFGDTTGVVLDRVKKLQCERGHKYLAILVKFLHA